MGQMKQSLAVSNTKCLACGKRLYIILNWNEKGHLLCCLTPFCHKERRPQGWEKRE